MTLLLDSQEAMARGVAALRRLDPVMERLLRGGAEPPLRKREPGFAGLVSIIVSQQLSTASAGAIWARLLAAVEPLTPETLLAAGDEDLRRAGLSGPKIRILRDAASAVVTGAIGLDELPELPAEEAKARLTALRGVGPWTADIYLMFCLGHPDAFAPGDLALQEAARLALGLDRRPDATSLAGLAERWRPWRTVAAGVLWAYYRQVKARDGILAA